MGNFTHRAGRNGDDGETGGLKKVRLFVFVSTLASKNGAESSHELTTSFPFSSLLSRKLISSPTRTTGSRRRVLPWTRTELAVALVTGRPGGLGAGWMESLGVEGQRGRGNEMLEGRGGPRRVGRGRRRRLKAGRRGLRGWIRNERRGRRRGVKIGDEVSFRVVLLLSFRGELALTSSFLLPFLFLFSSRRFPTPFSTSTSKHQHLFLLHPNLYPQRSSFDTHHLQRRSFSRTRSTSLEPSSLDGQPLSNQQQQPRSRRSSSGCEETR